MAHRRCTKCKQEVGPFEIRHKYAGGLFCEPCLGYQGGFVRRGFFSGIFSLFGLAQDFFKDLAGYGSAAKKRKQEKLANERVIQVAYNSMLARSRNIPLDAGSLSPQKR